MKIINIDGIEFELTNEKIRRIAGAIIETQNLLDKELAYSEHLQKKDMINFYRAHIVKLQGYLS